METFSLVLVNDYLDKINRGKKIKKSEYEQYGEIPIVDQGAKFIAGYTNEDKYLFRDVPITVFGDHTRRLKYLKFPFACGADGTQLLKAKEGFIQRFFYYALINLDLKNYGYERHFKYLKEEEIPKPGLETQQKIATILSNYDDLVENNEKRIKILENIAKLIYEEWFVRFKFPGHERVKMVDSETEFGMIPVGWEIKPAYDFSEIFFGFPFKSNLFCEKSNFNPIIRIRDILKNKTNTYSPEKADEKYLVRKGDILIGMDGIFHTSIWANKDSYLNQRVARIRPLDKSSRMFTFYSMVPNIKRLNVEIVGTTVQHLSQGDFQRMDLLIPSRDILQKYNQVAEPMLNFIIAFKLKNQNLRKTRDLLLPKLISGEIDVSDLNIQLNLEVVNT